MAKVIYEPHPVSPERKAELREKGYKIVDARFAPADQKRAEGGDKDSHKPSTVDELKEALTAKGVDIPEGAKKAELLALYDSQGGQGA